MSFNIKNIENIFSRIDKTNNDIVESESKIQKTIEKIENIENINNTQKMNDMKKLICLFLWIFNEYKYLNNYDENNLKYKELCSGYSKAYLMGAEWYKGENLPRTTYLSNNIEILKLYAVFILISMWKLKGN